MNANIKNGNDINEFILSDFSATSSVTSSRSGGIGIHFYNTHEISKKNILNYIFRFRR